MIFIPLGINAPHLLDWFGFMVLNATFNNISVISWQSVLLVEETRVPRENNRPSQVTDRASYFPFLVTWGK